MSLVSKARMGDKELRVFIDEDPQTPREWSNLGKMVCFHKRYNLPQEGERKFESPEGFDEWLKRRKVVILPIYMMDHSIQTVRTYPFGGLYGRFDSGQIGYIYATYDAIRKNFKARKVTPELIKKTEEVLKGEIEDFDTYLRGDIYRFEVVKLSKCNMDKEHEEHEDSCGGFFGHNFKENGLLDHAGAEWADVELKDA